jgi:tyrosyl-tRNA synthetase
MSELYPDSHEEHQEQLNIDNAEIQLMKKVDSICSIGEEVLDRENLINLLKYKKEIVAYDGFEPSGRMHIAQGLLRAHNVNKFTQAGVKFKFWVADWFALMNLKLGGDLKKIQKAGKDMIEIWKACGMDMTNVEIIWSSEEINKRSDEYWKLVLDIATKFTLANIKKCTTIMGKKEEKNILENIMELNEILNKLFVKLDSNDEFKEEKDKIAKLMEDILTIKRDELAASQIFYPVMQCADIFFLGVDICSLGLDQRKVNMLALEYCDKIKRKNKPIIVSHHMLMGLDGTKMSKSNPDNAVFMDDKPNEVKRKITQAFCEPGNIEKNPLLDWIKHIIIPIVGKFVIPANEKWNEPEIVYTDYNKLENDFKNQKVHPKGLKDGMTIHLNSLLDKVNENLKKK